MYRRPGAVANAVLHRKRKLGYLVSHRSRKSWIALDASNSIFQHLGCLLTLARFVWGHKRTLAFRANRVLAVATIAVFLEGVNQIVLISERAIAEAARHKNQMTVVTLLNVLIVAEGNVESNAAPGTQLFEAAAARNVLLSQSDIRVSGVWLQLKALKPAEATAGNDLGALISVAANETAACAQVVNRVVVVLFGCMGALTDVADDASQMSVVALGSHTRPGAINKRNCLLLFADAAHTGQ
jgi:hypothetical protein